MGAADKRADVLRNEQQLEGGRSKRRNSWNGMTVERWID